MTNPDLSIIIVNYNGREDLRRCLTALNANSESNGTEVLVVDNGSNDGSVQMVESEFEWVRVIRADENLGFARACNRGLGMARGRHAMLLNPDTEVMSGALERLIKALDENPRWGIVGPLMVDSQDRPYRAARRFPTPFRLFCETTRLTYCFPHSRWLAGYLYGERAVETLDAVDQIEGSALAISGAVRRVVGDLDPRFFIFFEEVDWCKRVHEAGFEIHVAQAARVRHHRATTMSRYYIRTRQIHAQSAMKYFQKHHGQKGLMRLRRWMWFGLTLRIWGMRLAFLLGAGDRAKLRAEGARLERAEYRHGLDQATDQVHEESVIP